MEKIKEMYSTVLGQTTNEKEYEPINLEEMERLTGTPTEMSRENSRSLLKDEEDDDLRRASLPGSPSAAPTTPPSRLAFFFWVAVNCLATLAIVMCNKQILSNPTLKGAPTLFVAYHFFLTAVTLHFASAMGGFERKRTPIISVLPLCFVFSFHTVVTNWSLALLDVAIYQELRILVTPFTVLINFLAYQKTISLRSMLALAVVCGGIAVTIYSDTQQKLALAAKASTSGHLNHVRAAVSAVVNGGDQVQALKNTPIGYAFGLAGVGLSALYTVWLAVYLQKLKCSSMQLLHMQSPLGCVLLLCFTPFLDTMPVWSDITRYQYFLIAMSGLSAVLINVSQFFIIAGSSAVSSTVVGHLKTCMIVSVGWATASSALALESGLGIMVAIVGIVSYSVVGLQESKAKAALNGH